METTKKCPLCAKDIPEQAKKCPECQGDIRNWFVRHWIITTILVFFILGVVLGDKDDKTENTTQQQSEQSEQTNEPNVKNKKATTAPIIKITSRKLYSEYKENELSADNKYKGKTIEVSGTVNNIKKDFLDNPYITIKGDQYIGDIQCMLNDSENAKAAALKKGSYISITGKLTGLILMNVTIENCKKKIIH